MISALFCFPPSCVKKTETPVNRHGCINCENQKEYPVRIGWKLGGSEQYQSASDSLSLEFGIYAPIAKYGDVGSEEFNAAVSNHLGVIFYNDEGLSVSLEILGELGDEFGRLTLGKTIGITFAIDSQTGFKITWFINPEHHVHFQRRIQLGFERRSRENQSLDCSSPGMLRLCSITDSRGFNRGHRVDLKGEDKPNRPTAPEPSAVN